MDGTLINAQIGAKVLLLKNLDSSNQLVNGATGVVTEFVEASGRKLPKVILFFVCLPGRRASTAGSRNGVFHCDRRGTFFERSDQAKFAVCVSVPRGAPIMQAGIFLLFFCFVFLCVPVVPKHPHVSTRSISWSGTVFFWSHRSLCHNLFVFWSLC